MLTEISTTMLKKKRSSNISLSSVENLHLRLFRPEIIGRPSYTNRFRTIRERYPGDSSPQRRTATVVRRVPESAIVEGLFR